MTNVHTAVAPSAGTDQILLEEIVGAIAQTVGMFAGAEPKPVPVNQATRICDAICGTISFVGDQSCSMMMCCPRESAIELALALAGFEIDYDSPDMGDAIGEIVNIIAGDIVARMESHGISIAMSLPTVFRGHDVERVLPHNMVSCCTLFEMVTSSFWVDVISGQTGLARPVQGVCHLCGR